MKWNFALIVATQAALLATAGACGGERVPPRSLVDARADFQRAKDGLAMQLDPTDVHEADVSLQQAERAWVDAPSDPNTDILAMVADRKALIAQARANEMKADGEALGAKRQVDATRVAQLQATQGALNQTQQALGATQMQLQQQQSTSAEQQQKLKLLESNLKDARDTIAKIASVKDDDRGMVITLQGEVLFATGKSDLKPGAMAKLDQIAEALRGKEQRIVVNGYTDSVGTRDNNMELSQRRADAVRSYLVSKGIPQDLITAKGNGPDAPIATNDSIEGRAQNRRVELVVQPKK
ncbi:MAG TPA: OmpA family protein [Polyangiaceae bacterium]|jgi:outer membrane protein OmpA-like peptidoglycan-associated protein